MRITEMNRGRCRLLISPFIPKRYERRKSFGNTRETIGITSNTVDTPVTASRKQLIQQVIHLEIRRNIAREEFEESEGGCYQLWINRAKFPGSVLTELPRENVQVYSSRTRTEKYRGHRFT
ncbi:hypothetical protein PUN28_005064 [Cardiocondyla obscurior]|uniref:Uncharacterized protein n=1 Tax=Cardiocondyla obscurior TaxID=286306 RepID=A0AAW2GFV5_9HYME